MVLMTLADRYNFSVDVDLTARGTGMLLKNGTWTGTTGGVHYRRYDIGLLVSLSLAGYHAIDMVFVQRDAVQFITKHPQVHTHFSNLSFPLQPPVRAWFLISFLVTAIMVYLLLRRGTKSNKSFYAVFIPYQRVSKLFCPKK